MFSLVFVACCLIMWIRSGIGLKCEKQRLQKLLDYVPATCETDGWCVLLELRQYGLPVYEKFCENYVGLEGTQLVSRCAGMKQKERKSRCDEVFNGRVSIATVCCCNDRDRCNGAWTPVSFGLLQLLALPSIVFIISTLCTL